MLNAGYQTEKSGTLNPALVIRFQSVRNVGPLLSSALHGRYQKGRKGTNEVTDFCCELWYESEYYHILRRNTTCPDASCKWPSAISVPTAWHSSENMCRFASATTIGEEVSSTSRHDFWVTL